MCTKVHAFTKSDICKQKMLAKLKRAFMPVKQGLCELSDVENVFAFQLAACFEN